MKDQLKLHTLIKLISYVKFGCRDFESSYFAGSPIVGELLSDFLIELNASTNKDTSLEIDPNTPFGRTLSQAVKWHISITDSWKDMDYESKKIHVINLLSPYTVKEKEIEMFIALE